MAVLEGVQTALWGWHTLVLILAAGIFFTVKTRFFQVRKGGVWLKASLGKGDKGSGGISQFQAVSTALAGSIGTGNIVGVAAAVTAGGPGAIFWMWISALLGMMTIYAENLLAARHRGAPGALGYVKSVKKWGGILAAVYAGGCCLSSLAMGNMAQTYAAAAALESFGVPKVMAGAGLALAVWAVARGGMKLGVKITEKLVPFMSLVFFGASILVVWCFRENLPQAVGSIFREAFSLKAGAGGSVGMLTAMRVGVSRGVFTNEAGLGSAAFAYDKVEGKSPEHLGCLGIFQVFVDTILMCTLTGVCILCCRSPMLQGAQLTFYAYESALGQWGGMAVSLCTALFALATVVAWCCYGREGLFYLTKGKGGGWYAAAAAGVAFLGCVAPLEAVFQVGDACNGLMALPNIAALFYFAREVTTEGRIARPKIEQGAPGKGH